MSEDPPSLQLILSEVSSAVRRAFSEGHRIGMQEAADRINKALAGTSAASALAPIEEESGKRVITRHFDTSGFIASDRRIPYGQVITSIRRAILAHPDVGLSRENLMELCFRQGIETNPNQFKDTLKRLVSGEEIVKRHLAYFRGPKLRLDLIPLDSEGLSSIDEEKITLEADQVENNGG